MDMRLTGTLCAIGAVVVLGFALLVAVQPTSAHVTKTAGDAPVYAGVSVVNDAAVTVRDRNIGVATFGRRDNFDHDYVTLVFTLSNDSSEPTTSLWTVASNRYTEASPIAVDGLTLHDAVIPAHSRQLVQVTIEISELRPGSTTQHVDVYESGVVSPIARLVVVGTVVPMPAEDPLIPAT